jgi:hypothetical protein
MPVAVLATVNALACARTIAPVESTDASDATSRLEQSEPGEAEEFGRLLSGVAARQQVEITWQGGPYSYNYSWGGGSAQDPADSEVREVAAHIVRELQLYPEGFLRRAGLTGVVLVRDLFVREDGGGRGAAAYIFEDRFFVDVPNAARAVRANTRVRFIHHLLWHRLDERAGTMWNDPEWSQLNPPNFEYGIYSRGGVHESRAGSGSLSAEFPGFLNLYSTGNLPDDKAEIFAYLMVIHAAVAERSRQDDHLRRKMQVVKARLAAVDPAFNDEFWRRINADSDDAARYGPQRQAHGIRDTLRVVQELVSDGVIELLAMRI